MWGVALVFACSGSAEAQVWNGYAGGWYGGLPYSVYSMDSVPYYALHPPVYYSHIVPRPYGYSPYAYPPYIMTPDSPPGSAPQVMINPHVTAPVRSEKKEGRVAKIEPRTILNPYVVGEVAGAPTARGGKRAAAAASEPPARATLAGKLAR